MNTLTTTGAANETPAIASAAQEGGHADHWFQVSPFGKFPHRVGLQVFDREAANSIVGLFNSAKDRLARAWRGLPIFVGHPDLDPKTYADHKKYGSIRALEVRPDGLYAQARWSKAGRELVNDEQYDFPSPLWNMEPVPREAGSFRPVELISVGLTNRPNIANKPVGANAAASSVDDLMKTKLITHFNLQPLDDASEVTDEQIDLALTQQRAAANERETLLTQLRVSEETRTRLERERAEQTSLATNERAARIDDQLIAAANAGRISEADKPAWRAQLESDFSSACTALAQLTPAMNTRLSMKTARLGERNGGEIAYTRAARIQAANEAVATRLKEDRHGDYAAAFAWVREHKPDLFKDMQEPAALHA